MSGQPQKVPRETLIAIVRERRAQGKTWKEIGRELGYSHLYLGNYWSTWNNGATCCDGSIARMPENALKESRDIAPSADIPAASGSETGRLR